MHVIHLSIVINLDDVRETQVTRSCSIVCVIVCVSILVGTKVDNFVINTHGVPISNRHIIYLAISNGCDL